MHKKLISLICVSAIFFASPAFAYKRDKGSEPKAPEQEEIEQQAPQGEGEATGEEYGGGGKGMSVAGYVLLVAGGMAAIAGSTIWAASEDHRTLGAIISGSGAAVSLAGTMMLVFGSRGGYAVGPTVDPKRNTYGLTLAGNF